MNRCSDHFPYLDKLNIDLNLNEKDSFQSNTNQDNDVTQTVLLDVANKFRQAFEVDIIISKVFLSDHVVNVAKLHILNDKMSTEKKTLHVRNSF